MASEERAIMRGQTVDCTASCPTMNAASPAPGSSADTVDIACAEDKILAMTGIDWRRQLERAQALGVGTMEYRLVGA